MLYNMFSKIHFIHKMDSLSLLNNSNHFTIFKDGIHETMFIFIYPIYYNEL